VLRKIVASQAEDHVAGILLSQGWRIIARNYRWIGTEVDILATKGDSLVAVEVKFRSQFPRHMDSLEHLLPQRKLNALRKGLYAAMRHLRLNPVKTRIDLAVVTPQDPVGQRKMPPGFYPEGTFKDTQIRGQYFRVAWYPAIGS